MRLINVHTWRLEEFPGADAAPRYAILSHTWGTGEVSYQDFQSLEIAQEKEGFAKIYLACWQAEQDGLQYVWVDTCCIDKSSSNELGEAINSMFKWYMNAAVCYVYLEDVPGNCTPLSDDDFVHPRQLQFIGAFEESRWFTRGWTLQELIAPRRLLFFGKLWNFIGTRQDLMHRVSGVTNIQTDVLDQTKPLAYLSVARRLSWAASRQTTRKEDEAYALLGILDVNMPLLYGEGEKAFLRLQEEIIKQSTDQSIFAWNSPSGFLGPGELLLAPSPRCFRNAGKIRRRRYAANETSFRISNKGLEITLPVISRRLQEDPTQPYVMLGILDCKYENCSEVLALVMNQHPVGISSGTLALELYVSGYEHDVGQGLQYSRLHSIHPDEIEAAQLMQLTITKDLHSLAYMQAFSTNEASWFPLCFTGGDSARLPSLRNVYPDRCWSESSKTMRLRIGRVPSGAVVVDTKDGLSVLICFGMDVARARNIPPQKKLFGMSIIDPSCPIRPHLDRTIMKCEGSTSETCTLRLNRRESVVARLWQGALTVCVENGGESSGSITGLPQTMSPIASPLTTAPTSPQLYNRRPSSSKRRDSWLTDAHAQARKDSLLQDDASSASSQDGAPRTSRLRTCAHCVEITEAERAEQAMKIAAEREKFEADEAARKRRERNAKVLEGAKKASVGASVGGMLWDLAEGLEYLV